MTPAVENHIWHFRRRISDDGTSRSGNRSGGGWLGVTALFRGEPRTPSGDQRHDIIAGSLYHVDMDCWKMDTKSDRFYIQHLPAGIDQSVVLPGFRGYCSLHSGIKIRAVPLSGGNLSMVHLLVKLWKRYPLYRKMC